MPGPMGKGPNKIEKAKKAVIEAIIMEIFLCFFKKGKYMIFFSF